MDDRDRTPDEETSLENPLGIANAPVTPDAPEHLRASDDPEEVRRRRQRALAEDPNPRLGMGDVNRDHKGATGIDMGSGGQGTHVSGD